MIDAGNSWSTHIFETTDSLKKSHGGRKSSVIAIGSAEEYTVAFSLASVAKLSLSVAVD